MKIGIPDKLLINWLKGKKYIIAADEGEGTSICCGVYLATGKKATMFLSADGFMNALNCITSYMIPEKIPVNFVISTGRQEPQHKMASDLLPKLLEELKLEKIGCKIKLIF